LFSRNMEALFELVVTFVTLLVELTVQAVVFLFLLVMAAFDPGARRKLKEQWDRSIWQRVSMVSLGVIYAGVLVFVVVMWVRFSGGGEKVVEREDRKEGIRVEISGDGEPGVRKGEVIEKLLDKAGSVIRRKLEDRKRETEGGAEGGEGR
jgi:hypothetical protein